MMCSWFFSLKYNLHKLKGGKLKLWQLEPYFLFRQVILVWIEKKIRKIEKKNKKKEKEKQKNKKRKKKKKNRKEKQKIKEKN